MNTNALLPENFDLQRHIEQYPPAAYGLTKFVLDFALHLLGLITLIPMRNKTIANEMENGYTPMNAALMQKDIRDYRKYLDYFIDTGVIETDGKCRPSCFFPGNQKSYGFRFKAPYCFADITPVPYGPKFTGKLNKSRRRDFKALEKDYGHLTKWLWPTCHLQIDAPTAYKYLLTKRNAQIRDHTLRDERKRNIYGDIFYKDPNDQYKFGKSKVDSLKAGDIECVVDDNVGRMHTLLTNINSKLRNLITFKGQSLVSIDIKNSQPYMATLLFNRGFYDNLYLNINIKYNKHTSNKHTPLSSLMLVEIENMIDNEDVILYKSLVGKIDIQQEDLYTYMLEKCKEDGLPFTKREEVKKVIFEVFFTSNRHSSPAKRLFANLFPSVDKLFRIIKAGEHEQLPLLLQRIEAYFMLGVITKRIAKECPTAPLFTIHDSIATTVEHVEKVEAIMHEELTSLVGIAPKLKVEEWSPKNFDWDRYTLG